MKQEIETNTVLDLGCVSADTKGSTVAFEDIDSGQRLKQGLSDD